MKVFLKEDKDPHKLKFYWPVTVLLVIGKIGKGKMVLKMIDQLMERKNRMNGGKNLLTEVLAQSTNYWK